MTAHERAERARQAKIALDEFLAPAFALVERDYAEKMISTAASTDPRAPEIIARLANAIKAMRQAQGLIENTIADGVLAREEIERAKNLDALTGAKRRLLAI